MTSKMKERMAQDVQRSDLWHIQVKVMREDSVWLGTAVACCDTKIVPVLRAVRYGATAEGV